ncbi:hypothetical protein [Nonomuraea sp. NPDC050783]|uniref:hypothetical protein n=1 Tax=Nonomuraea sp. NPDC050783 TaxID=3154634 RepID=UPI003466D1DF
MTRRRTARFCLAALVLLTVSCTPDHPSFTPSPARGDVIDRPPYLCYFIPQAAVAELTGYTGRYTAGSGKSSAADSCAVTNDVQSILLTGYERAAEHSVIEKWMRNGEENGRVRLPQELGTGSIDSYEVRGYPFRSAGALFRCGDENSLITIYIKKNPARNQDHDLVQLMRIAQRRFAEMFKCKPGGPPQG